MTQFGPIFLPSPTKVYEDRCHHDTVWSNISSIIPLVQATQTETSSRNITLPTRSTTYRRHPGRYSNAFPPEHPTYMKLKSHLKQIKEEKTREELKQVMSEFFI